MGVKGIVLAGGKATRLYPVTKAVCKQLLPVYDKPLVYYPLSVLLLAGIRDILLITLPEVKKQFKSLLGDGKQLGISIYYEEQKMPGGIGEAFIIGEDFISKERVCLILGDNIFYGHGLGEQLNIAMKCKEGAQIFAYYVSNPHRYGVLEFDEKGRVVAIEEKPKIPKSKWVVTGLYFYDNEVISIAKSVKPSLRNELEITDINRVYLERGKLKVSFLGRGYAWLDIGTPEALIEASMFIKAIEDRQGLKVGCIEEIVYRLGYITKEQLLKLTQSMGTAYFEYLKQIAQG
ncbi:MAG: glucose-1-phosphate thymidylyltransferase RfbA [Candidatus Omnitrophica bacterium]|nr:glucose-1-phosphate thymidylyltransferase RfbA [Candidatus Omnitrophota bacterium]